MNSLVAYETQDDFRPLLWRYIVGLAMFAGLGLAWTGFRVDASGTGPIAALTLLSAALSHMRPRLSGPLQLRLAETIELLAIFSLLAILACLSTYPLAALGGPLADPWLAAADSLIGFDWQATYALVEASPPLRILSAGSYQMIFCAPLILLIALGMNGQGRQARQFIVAYAITITVSLCFFVVAPAIDPVAFYAIDTSKYMPMTGTQADVLQGIRAGTLREVRFETLAGMISFPSVHAASALLFTWAARGNRYLQLTVGVLSGLMLAATPIEGNHYLIDLLAGLVTGAFAIHLSNILLDRMDGRAMKQAVAVPA